MISWFVEEQEVAPIVPGTSQDFHMGEETEARIGLLEQELQLVLVYNFFKEQQ